MGGGEAGPPRGARRPREIPAGPAPDAASLREAALNHLARFASTESNLIRVLQRRIARWAQRAEREGQPPEEVARRVASGREMAAQAARDMVSAGAVDDAAFAAARARRLSRAGRSRRAVAAHLAAKGVAAETAVAVLEDGAADELDAALAHLRRRQQGPFAPGTAGETVDAAARLKALGALARAGFPRDIAERALDLSPEEATDRLLAARRD